MFGLKVQIVLTLICLFFLFPKTGGILFVLLLPLPQRLFDIVGLTIVIGLVYRVGEFSHSSFATSDLCLEVLF